jgi:hypothetical protein
MVGMVFQYSPKASVYHKIRENAKPQSRQGDGEENQANPTELEAVSEYVGYVFT